jgi:hypothetical protein
MEDTPMIRQVVTAVVGGALAAALAVGSVAAANPPGTGQPGQSCQAEPAGPPGLLSTTNGFATPAVIVYAGSSGSHSLVSNNPHAVSQYDVACFQVSQQSH